MRKSQRVWRTFLGASDVLELPLCLLRTNILKINIIVPDSEDNKINIIFQSISYSIYVGYE